MLQHFSDLPGYGLGGLLVLLLYVLQTELRFGAKARAMRAGAADRGSTIALSLAMVVPVLGFVSSMKGLLPKSLDDALPGMPATAWVGVAAGAVGLLLRLWAVLTLKERFTRTLLVHEKHEIERGGPYAFVRHPGYLGSLLCLNGVAAASGNLWVVAASIVCTGAAYAYRVSSEDRMMVQAFGAQYEDYRREVRGLVPFIW